MADIEFTQDVAQTRAAPPQGSGLGMMANLAGAAISLALLVGVGVWGYKLMVRDVSGVPVVRALDGPMRIQPENPGGRPADNQGLAVNAVAADGAAEAPADTLILAPQPVDLTAEDAPAAQLVRPAPRSPTPAQQPSQSDDIEALVAQITAGVAPLTENAAEPDPQPAGVPRDIVEVADLTSKQVLEAMEAVALKVAQQVLSKKGFSFDIPSRASSNQIYVRDWDRIVLGGKRSTRSFLNAKENRKSAITLRVMQLLHSVYVTIIRYFGRCMPAVLGFSPGCLNFMADCANPFM